MASTKFVLAFALLATLAVSAAYAEVANDIAEGTTRDLKTLKLGGLKSKIFGHISKGHDNDHHDDEHDNDHHDDGHDNDHHDDGHDNNHGDHKKVFKLHHNYDHSDLKKVFKIKHDYDHKKVFNTLKVQHKKRCEDKCYCYFLQGHYFKHYQHGCKEVECDCHKYSHAVFKKVQKCH